MNMQQLQYFDAVARMGSYTKAGEALYVTRQAISKSVKQLEEEVGVQLLTTSNGVVSLTAAGASFLEDVKPALEAFSSLEGKYHLGKSPLLSLALAQGGLHPFPDDYLERFIDGVGGTAVSVEEMSSDAVVAMVRSGECEIGVLGTHPKYIQEFDYLALAHPGYYVSVPCNHPLAEKTYLELSDIEGQHFVTLGKRNHLHRFFMEQCAKHDVHPDVLVESSEMTLFEKYRREGSALAFACAPKSTQPYHDARYLPLGMADAQWFGSYAIRRKNAVLSPLASKLMDYLEETRLA